MGAMMGGCTSSPPATDQTAASADIICTAVGLIIGFIFGATNIIRFGPGPQGMMRTLGQYMLGSAATFG